MTSPSSLRIEPLHSVGFVCSLMVAAAVTLALSGCARKPPSPPQEAGSASSESHITAEELELRRSLDAFVRYFEATVESAVREIERRATKREQQEAALLWQINTIDRVEEVLESPDPRLALLDLWALSARMEDYLVEGEGKDLFIPNEAIAQAAARNIHTRAQQLAKRYLAEKDFERVRVEVEAHADEQPVTGVFSNMQTIPFTIAERGTSMLMSGVNFTLSPLMAVGKLPQGVESVTGLKGTADRFTDVIDDLPEKTRWQLKLLLLDMADNDAITSALVSLDRASRVSERLASVAETLPDELTMATQKILTDLEKTQPELQRTLEETRALSTSLEATLRQAEGALAAFESVVARFQDRPKTPKAEDDLTSPRRPFDITEYEATARALEGTLGELDASLQSLQSLLESDALEKKVDRLNDEALRSVDALDQHARGFLNLAVLRAAQLLALFFALLLVYRVLSSRLTRRQIEK